MRPLERQSHAACLRAFHRGAATLVAACSAAAALCQGCDRATCDELHDPACWIPPVIDAGPDADGSDEGAADAEDGGDVGVADAQDGGDAGDGSTIGD